MAVELSGNGAAYSGITAHRRRVRFDSAGLVDPGHLDRFEDLLAGMTGVIVEIREFQHPVVEVGEADRARIDFGVGFGEFDGDIERIRPLHFNDLP